MPIVALVAALVLLAFYARARDRSNSSSSTGQNGSSGDSAGTESGAGMPSAPGFVAAVAGAGERLAEAMSGAVEKIKTWVLPPEAAPYADAIRKAEVENAIPDGLLGRLLYEESRFRPDIIDGRKVSSAGALGIAQFMPQTAQELRIDPLDPFQAIDAAARYLRKLFDQFGSWTAALAAYNWGPGNVARKGVAAAPAETKRYVSAITADVGVI